MINMCDNDKYSEIQQKAAYKLKQLKDIHQENEKKKKQNKKSKTKQKQTKEKKLVRKKMSKIHQLYLKNNNVKFAQEADNNN